MRRFNENNRVVVIKQGDRNYNKTGIITSVGQMTHAPVTIYNIKFDDGSKGYYFFSEINHI